MPERKRKRIKSAGTPAWMVTYSDMTTLLLTFFVVMFTVATVEESEIRLLLSAFKGLGPLSGGNTFTTVSVNKLAEMGNNVMALPSSRRGKSFDNAAKLAVSIFSPEIKSKKVRITEDERGLVISLSADAFFATASDEVNIEEARKTLQNVSGLLRSEAMEGRKFRIEGHADNTPTDSERWRSNWELSTDRALNVLYYLKDFGVDEKRLQVAGFGDTVPLMPNDTKEGRAYNRRVDIVILSEGHLDSDDLRGAKQ